MESKFSRFSPLYPTFEQVLRFLHENLFPDFVNVLLLIMIQMFYFLFSWIFGVKCFFGFAGCSSSAGTAGMLYIAMHILSHLTAGLLMRFSEGATLLAIVQVRTLC